MRSATTVLLCTMLAAACCLGPPPVGYQGPLPSVAARQSLRGLWGGAKLPAGTLAFTDEEIELVGFVVGPSGPTVNAIETGSFAGTPKRHWITVLTDGDIADLHRRAGCSAPAGIAGELSSTYRKQVVGS